jgi:cardiolipin synthase
MSKISTVPNILTISRVFLLPFFGGGFFMDGKLGALISAIVFSFCCLTDYLDGYYARTYKQMTKIGQILDPLADKILISVSLLFISGFGLIQSKSIIPAAIILGREIIISGIREGTASFVTSKLSKLKTATQMIAITLILSSRCFDCNIIKISGELALWGSAIMSIVSGIAYCKHGIARLKQP